MSPYESIYYHQIQDIQTILFNPYPPVIKRGKLMQAGKNLHFYTHIYSGLPHLFHIFSQLRSPPFGVGISMDFPSSQGMSHIFKIKNIHVCLSHMEIHVQKGGFHGISIDFNHGSTGSLFRHKKDFWSPHLGPS